MGDRRPGKRGKPQAGDPLAGADVFAEFGLDRAEFDVTSGGGLSFLAHQGIVWMEVTHKPSGRKVSAKIGTSKKRKDGQYDGLLRHLLQAFRR